MLEIKFHRILFAKVYKEQAKLWLQECHKKTATTKAIRYTFIVAVNIASLVSIKS